jgi:hypothetical protein
VKKRTFHVQKNQSRVVSIDASVDSFTPALAVSFHALASCHSEQSPPDKDR